MNMRMRIVLLVVPAVLVASLLFLVPTFAASGTVRFAVTGDEATTQTFARQGGNITLEVTDSDLDNDTGSAVKVTSQADPVGISVVLTETGPATGIFRLTILATASPSDASASPPELQVGVNDLVTLRYTDASPAQTVSATLQVETTPPVFSNLTPAHNSAGAVSRPLVEADVTDADSGLKDTSIRVIFGVDSTGDGAIEGTPQDVDVKGQGVALDVITGGFRAKQRLPQAMAPSNVATVYWWVWATDIAGNVGISDRTATTADPCDSSAFSAAFTGGSVANLVGKKPGTSADVKGCQPFAVKVDFTKPVLLSAKTGPWWDTSKTTTDKTELDVTKAKNTSILVTFSEDLDGTSVQASDFQVDDVAPTNAESFSGAKSSVFLTVPGMAGDATPKVELVGEVKDVAGNAQTTGSIAAATDGIEPFATVNSTDDLDDSVCNATHCSLREAITAANANSGTDTIAFNIPTSDPGFNATTSAFTIQPTSALPTITDPVVIDGYTQSGASPNTNGPGLGLNTVLKIELDGTNAGGGANGLHITAGSSTVRGLSINRFGGAGTQFGSAGIQIEGSGSNVVEGNFIGTDISGSSFLENSGSGVRIITPNNTVGGTTAAARNVISGNRFIGVNLAAGSATGNVVEGNFIGTDLTGTVALGNSHEGVSIVSVPNNMVGGVIAGARNVISGNKNGVSIEGGPATGNVVQGNFIGTDVTGTAPLGNSGIGVYINGSGNTVGGVTAGAGNVISGNGTDGLIVAGVFVTGDPVPGGATGNVVQGNLIGTDAGGTAAIGNGGNGVLLKAAPNGTVGGTAPDAWNTIAFNGGDGVFVQSGTSTSILSNSIFSNSGLGIDLAPDGVTANDTGDPDTGANNLQNFPHISKAEINNAGNLVVHYSVDSATGNSAYPLRIEFFEADSVASGEGKTLLGSDSYATSSAQSSKVADLGNAAALGVTSADVVVATATDAGNNTSEFSGSTSVIVAPTPTPIPGLTQWGLIAMAGFFALSSVWLLKGKVAHRRG